jgi:hypothetical protein
VTGEGKGGMSNSVDVLTVGAGAYVAGQIKQRLANQLD